jgi:hypothetical protein
MIHSPYNIKWHGYSLMMTKCHNAN